MQYGTTGRGRVCMCVCVNVCGDIGYSENNSTGIDLLTSGLVPSTRPGELHWVARAIG